MNHKEEIIKTRSIGFGSSDAKLISSVGKTGQLNETARKRIAEMLGLKEREEISTYAIELGNEIEQRMYESIKSCASEQIKVHSNPFYKSEKMSEELGLALFNHIDVEIEMPTKIVWYEIKATIKDIDKTEEEYRYQLAWHWMLLSEKAEIEEKKSVLMLAHYDTSSGVDVFDHEKVNTKQISYADCWPYIKEIYEGLSVIHDELKDFKYKPQITTDGDNLPIEIQKLLPSIDYLLRQAKEAQDKADQLKEQLKEAMEQSGTKSIDNEFFKATYIPEGLTAKFDSKSFQKTNPDIYSQFLKTSKVKSQLRLTLK